MHTPGTSASGTEQLGTETDGVRRQRVRERERENQRDRDRDRQTETESADMYQKGYLKKGKEGGWGGRGR